MTTQVFQTAPKEFTAEKQIVSCYIEHNNKLLLLQRAAHKPHGSCWGDPAGKVDDGENLTEALLREVREETGIELESTTIHSVGTLFIQSSPFNFAYHMYYVNRQELPDVVLNEEHQRFQWQSIDQLSSLCLVPGAVSALETFSHWKIKHKYGF